MSIIELIPHTTGAVTGALTGLILAYIVGTAFYNLYLHPLARYPGPKFAAISEISFIYHWTSGRWPSTVRDLHKRYGDVVRVAPNQLTFASAQSYRDIYGHASKTRRPFDKLPSFYNADKKHRSIVDASGEDHRNQRKLLSHAFSAKALRDQEDVVQHYVNLFTTQLGTWSSRPSGINIVEALNWITFDIIGDLAFGESFKAVETGKSHPWVSILLDSVRMGDIFNIGKRVPLMKLFLPFLAPSDLRAKAISHWEYIDTMMKKRIDKKDTITRTDFFQHILENGTMEEGLLKENSHVLIIAGSETTATALAGCLYHLLHNLTCLATLQGEVRDAFGGLDEITATSTQRLSYLHACIEEALRIFPPVPFGLPRVSYGASVDGNWVPAGTEVSTQNWAIKRDPRYWQDPDSFRPERWIGEGFGDEKGAFNPFSLGPRVCIGINLAYMEMHLILAKMVWQYDFELLNKGLEWDRDNQMYVLWHKPALNMKFHLREGVQA